MFSEPIIVLLIAAIVIVAPLATFILAVVAFSRSQQIAELTQRIGRLEQQLAGQAAAAPGSPGEPGQSDAPSEPSAALPVSPDLPVPPDPPVPPDSIPTPTCAGPAAAGPVRPLTVGGSAAVRRTIADSSGWELFLGQKAFGWVAVLLFALATALFLRHAFHGNWIGPLGRVLIGQSVGLALVAAGGRYQLRGWQRFSGMLTAAGFAALYLATYGAHALYQLLPASHLAIFLTVIVIQSMVAAACYRSLPVAVATVIGGLTTPLLLTSDIDTYRSFFSYLLVFNVAVVAASWYRRWPVVATLAWAGTQLLFWLWYAGNYHPEKQAWALGLQAIVFLLYWLHSLARGKAIPSQVDAEELVRYLLLPLVGFAALEALVLAEHPPWRGVAAVAVATFYAATAHRLLTPRPADLRLLLTSLALALGFLAWALPLQAHATGGGLDRWVAAGWAIIGWALYRFGLRIGAAALRMMAAVLAVAAIHRWLWWDLPWFIRQPFVPILNEYGLPATIIAAAILTSVMTANRRRDRPGRTEQTALTIASIGGVVLLGVAWSFEFYGFLVSQSIDHGQLWVWRQRGQLALTLWWTVYATALMVAGFRLDRARLRWLAMLLYVVTVGKLFLVDLATVQQLYRIIGFFVLSVVLALVARAYQRLSPSAREAS